MSPENALANIQAELPGGDFAQVRQAAQAKWNQELSKVTIETKEPVVRRTFYTALYHAWFAPALFNDTNGDYRGADD